MLRRFVGTAYLDRPVWLYDYAALAFQVGEYQEAAGPLATCAWTTVLRGQQGSQPILDGVTGFSQAPAGVLATLAPARRETSVDGDVSKAGRLS